MDDAPRVKLLADHAKVSDTTRAIPHPYPDGLAEQWISIHDRNWHEKSHAVWAICLKDGTLVGGFNIASNATDNNAWLGYWIGVDYWGQGYCTEAGHAIVAFGFDFLKLNRIYAEHLIRNPASGRVMQKLEMMREGVLRQHYRKNGVYEDSGLWGILRSEYVAENQKS